MTNQSMKEYSEEQFTPIKRVIDALEDLLRHKNRKYGASGLQSGGVFSRQPTLEKLLARADDKVARIQNSPTLQRNDVADLAGYLLLIMAHQEWDNLEDQKD